MPIFGASHELPLSASSDDANRVNASRRAVPDSPSACAMLWRTAAIREADRHLLRSSWSTNALASGKLGGHTIFGWPCTLSWSQCTVLAASISFCDTYSVGTSSATSRPRAISELMIWPLYQYADHEPPMLNRVESIGPRSK